MIRVFIFLKISVLPLSCPCPSAAKAFLPPFLKKQRKILEPISHSHFHCVAVSGHLQQHSKALQLLRRKHHSIYCLFFVKKPLLVVMQEGQPGRGHFFTTGFTIVLTMIIAYNIKPLAMCGRRKVATPLVQGLESEMKQVLPLSKQGKSS